MKRIYTLAVLLFSLTAYSQAYEGNVEYNKKKQQAIQIDYSYSQEAVENAIVQKIEKMGYKAKAEKGMFNKDKGFIVFKNAFVTDISDNSMDYIIKVDRKSRKEKDETTLYLIMNKGDVNALTEMDAMGVGKAKSFLNNLLPEIEEADLELQIKTQDESVVKSEKKFKDMQDERASLEKKLKKLDEDIINQEKQIESGRAALEGLKGKRKVKE
jgi:hypothetical protein